MFGPAPAFVASPAPTSRPDEAGTSLDAAPAPTSCPDEAARRRGRRPTALPSLESSLGGSQQFLGAVTASMLGLPLAEHEAARTAARASAALTAGPSSSAPVLAAAAASPAHAPQDDVPVMLRALALLLAMHAVWSFFGWLSASYATWKAQAAIKADPASQLNRALDQAGVSKSRAERNAAMVDHYNSQVLKERQQVLREALAERPVSKAEEQHWLAQRWPRLPMESVPRAPPPEEWENI